MPVAVWHMLHISPFFVTAFLVWVSNRHSDADPWRRRRYQRLKWHEHLRSVLPHSPLVDAIHFARSGTQRTTHAKFRLQVTQLSLELSSYLF